MCTRALGNQGTAHLVKVRASVGMGNPLLLIGRCFSGFDEIGAHWACRCCEQENDVADSTAPEELNGGSEPSFVQSVDVSNFR